MADGHVFNIRYNDTVSSLSQAAAIGNLKAVEALLRKGRLPQATDNRGWSAVHSCVYAKQLEALKMILNFRKGNKKYLANLLTWENETPLMIAVKSDSVSMDVVRLLLKCRSNPNTSTCEGMTALHYACRKTGNLDLVKLLIKYGAGVNTKEHINEYTPLHYAIVEAADLDIIKFLIERCDVNLSDSDCETPLYKASVCNFLEAVELILEKDKSSVNVIPRSRLSPLSAAAFNGNLKMVKLLLDAGASAEISGSEGFHRYPLNEENTLPIHLSVGYPDVFRLLLRSTNPEALLELEETAPIAIYAMMYGPGSDCFETVLKSEIPRKLRIVDSESVADFIIGFPFQSDEIFSKFRLLFKYCINLEAEIVLERIGTRGLNKLGGKLKFLHFLAEIGVSPAVSKTAKNDLIQALEDEEIIRLLRQSVLSLKQLSRAAVRRFFASCSENTWTAYTFLKNFPLPNNMKQYLWCQILS